MNTDSFVIRRAFLTPLGLLALLILSLAVVCVAQGQPRGKVIILACLLAPVLGLFVESLFRKVTVGEETLTVRKFLRRKSLAFEDVTAVDLVTVKKRAFLTLSTEESFLILSNAYQGFPSLVQSLLQRVPAGAIDDETRQKCAAVPVKSSDIVSCWLAVGLVLFILYLQLFG